MDSIRIGISACLLGHEVRFDRGHKRDAFLSDTFGRFVSWVPVCPEVECGLGTPRESMRLVDRGSGIRLVTVRSNVDMTARLAEYAEERVARLAQEDLCGYVLKKDSPSCGLERVKVYDANAVPSRTGRGLFAARLLDRMPDLPIEEEGRLSDPRLRENFIQRVFAYRRLRSLFGAGWTTGALVRFHAAHKLMLMAHSPAAYLEMGRLVARAASMQPADVERAYRHAFMSALTVVASRGRHANALQHMAGYLKDRLDRESRAELATAIADYRAGLVPLVAPMTLLRHHIRRHEVSYLLGQHYVEPHPKELGLRNGV
jgi:uncharacterized protein YbgA (DUF1722 family)/uncharacterized protein YbbK (DUF523 family)